MASGTVKQWTTLQDGLDNLKLGTAPMPSPGKGEVLVKIKTVALNYRDTEVAMGLYGHHKSIEAGSDGSSEPLVVCSDMCGEVVAAGDDAKWRVGDRVLSIFSQGHMSGPVDENTITTGLGLPLEGVLQEYRVFPSTGLVKAPGYMSDEEAACLPIAAVTAWMSINQFRPLGQPGGEGETVLLQGTGGVATMGLQLAHAAGATTIVTSSSDDKLEKARSLGADHVINYVKTPDWDEAVMKLTNNRGADIILECGGAQTLRKSFSCVAYGGIISCIGYLSGKQDEPGDRTNVNVLALTKNVTLKGVMNGPRDRFEELLGFVERNQIHPVIDRVFKFEEGKEALKYLFSGKHFGKVVVKVDQ